MTQQKKMQSNILTLVAPAFQEKSYNMAFVDSMLNQTRDNGWKAICIHNGPSHNSLSYSEKKADNQYESRIQFLCSDKNTGNYGCDNRQQCIDNCDTEYILQTSIQDYWLPQAMDYILKTLERTGADIVIWDSINHLVGPCQVLKSELEWSKVDWGNFCIRTDIAKKVGINHGDSYCADWGFVLDVLQSGLVDQKKIIKLPYVLTIHN